MGPRRYLIQENIIPQLIREVKKRDCIWNTEHESYNDRYQTAVAWREIAQSMKKQEEILRSKWKNLRDLFRREMKKYKDLDSVDVNTGKWRYFKKMWFIHKPSEANIEYNDEEDDDDGNIEETFLEEYDEDTAATFVKCEPQLEAEEIDHLEIEIDRPTESRKRKHESDKCDDDNDYDMMYLKSLTPYFRHLEPIRKLIVRSKIQDILINEIAAQAQGNNKFS